MLKGYLAVVNFSKLSKLALFPVALKMHDDLQCAW